MIKNMIFTIGLEMPSDTNTSIGIVVPALCTNDYSTYSAADDLDSVEKNVKEVIELVFEDMEKSELENISDLGIEVYKADKTYSFCNRWIQIEFV